MSSYSSEQLQQQPKWELVPAVGPVGGRGIGALDMARRIRTGGQPVASGQLAYHVLDTMIAIEESIATGDTVTIASSVDPLPLIEESWDPYQATLGA